MLVPRLSPGRRWRNISTLSNWWHGRCRECPCRRCPASRRKLVGEAPRTGSAAHRRVEQVAAVQRRERHLARADEEQLVLGQVVDLVAVGREEPGLLHHVLADQHRRHDRSEALLHQLGPSPTARARARAAPPRASRTRTANHRPRRRVRRRPTRSPRRRWRGRTAVDRRRVADGRRRRRPRPRRRRARRGRPGSGPAARARATSASAAASSGSRAVSSSFNAAAAAILAGRLVGRRPDRSPSTPRSAGPAAPRVLDEQRPPHVVGRQHLVEQAGRAPACARCRCGSPGSSRSRLRSITVGRVLHAAAQLRRPSGRRRATPSGRGAARGRRRARPRGTNRGTSRGRRFAASVRRQSVTSSSADVALEVDDEAVVAEALLGGPGLELGEVERTRAENSWSIASSEPGGRRAGSTRCVVLSWPVRAGIPCPPPRTASGSRDGPRSRGRARSSPWMLGRQRVADRGLVAAASTADPVAARRRSSSRRRTWPQGASCAGTHGTARPRAGTRAPA